MELSVISFTEKGMRLSERLSENMAGSLIRLYTKGEFAGREKIHSSIEVVEERVTEWAGKQMKQKRTLLFIGACGIAVRSIAPFVTDKLLDSAVLVMDEAGNYVIPLLSGHVGGANAAAVQLAEKMNAIPVITTATDIEKRFAVDLFAVHNGLHIVNREGIARISAKVLAGKEITMAVDMQKIEGTVPEQVRLLPYHKEQEADVVIASEKSRQAMLSLAPKEYVVGMGCKKGKEEAALLEWLLENIKNAGISMEQIWAIASVDQKKEEPGLLELCRKNKIPFLTFPAEELQEIEGEFQESSFVKEQIGTDNVCERAAIRACGGEGTIIYHKHAGRGMTIAIAKRKWGITFEKE